jgi:hypothetical protein
MNEEWIRKSIGGKKVLWNPSNNHCYEVKENGSMGKWLGIYNPNTARINTSIKEPINSIKEPIQERLTNSSGSEEIEITHIFAKGEHIPMNEVTSKLIEKREPGPASNKWLHPSRDSWIEAEFRGPYIVKSYILQSANNVPQRDPLEWRLIGKTISGDWIPLSQQKGIFERRHLKKEFPVEVNTPVISVRLIIDKNNGDAYTQLARIKFMGIPSKIYSQPNITSDLLNVKSSTVPLEEKVIQSINTTDISNKANSSLFSRINNSRPAGTGIHAIRKLGVSMGGKRKNKTRRTLYRKKFTRRR